MGERKRKVSLDIDFNFKYLRFKIREKELYSFEGKYVLY